MGEKSGNTCFRDIAPVTSNYKWQITNQELQITLLQTKNDKLQLAD